MNHRAKHILAATALLTACSFQVQQKTQTVNAAQRPQVIVRRASTLDAHGHGTRTFRAGHKIELRIQWVVRHAPKGARQTVEWTVLYAGHQIFHVSRHSRARNGKWVQIATATISRRARLGRYIFRARVRVAGVTAQRSAVFTLKR